MVCINFGYEFVTLTQTHSVQRSVYNYMILYGSRNYALQIVMYSLILMRESAKKDQLLTTMKSHSLNSRHCATRE